MKFWGRALYVVIVVRLDFPSTAKFQSAAVGYSNKSHFKFGDGSDDPIVSSALLSSSSSSFFFSFSFPLSSEDSGIGSGDVNGVGSGVDDDDDDEDEDDDEDDDDDDDDDEDDEGVKGPY